MIRNSFLPKKGTKNLHLASMVLDSTPKTYNTMLENASFFVFKAVISMVQRRFYQIRDVTLSIKIKETRQKRSFFKPKFSIT